MDNIDVGEEDVPALLGKGVDDVIFSSLSGHNLDVDQPGQARSFQTLQRFQLAGDLVIVVFRKGLTRIR